MRRNFKLIYVYILLFNQGAQASVHLFDEGHLNDNARKKVLTSLTGLSKEIGFAQESIPDDVIFKIFFVLIALLPLGIAFFLVFRNKKRQNT